MKQKTCVNKSRLYPLFLIALVKIKVNGYEYVSVLQDKKANVCYTSGITVSNNLELQHTSQLIEEQMCLFSEFTIVSDSKDNINI